MEDNVSKQIDADKTGKYLHIALCVNDNWATYVGPLLYAINQHNRNRQTVVHLVYRDISEEKLDKLVALAELLDNLDLDLCYLSEGMIDEISVDHYYLPIETYFRLMLPELLPEVERVIYLDVDTQVLGDLSELYQMDLGNSCIGAAKDQDVHSVLSHHLGEIGYTEEDTYFNAGVLLLDLERMRERNLSAILIDEASRKVKELTYGDQDLLNLYFKNEVVYFENKYNYLSQSIRAHQAGDDVRIVHFNGPQKPWRSYSSMEKTNRIFASIYKQNNRAVQALLQSEHPNITILVNARNARPNFLYDCVSSILEQTYSFLDIVLVNQGISDDETKLDDLMSYDNRIQRFSGSTQEDILSQTSGSYFFFIDGNDFIEPDAIESLYQLAVRDQADCILPEYYTFKVNESVFSVHLSPDIPPYKLSVIDSLKRESEFRTLPMAGLFCSRKVFETAYLEENWLQTPHRSSHSFYLASQNIYCLPTSLLCHRTFLPLTDDVAYYRHKQEDISYFLATLSLYKLPLGLTLGYAASAIRDLQSLLNQESHYSTYINKQITIIDNN